MHLLVLVHYRLIALLLQNLWLVVFHYFCDRALFVPQHSKNITYLCDNPHNLYYYYYFSTILPKTLDHTTYFIAFPPYQQYPSNPYIILHDASLHRCLKIIKTSAGCFISCSSDIVIVLDDKTLYSLLYSYYCTFSILYDLIKMVAGGALPTYTESSIPRL